MTFVRFLRKSAIKIFNFLKNFLFQYDDAIHMPQQYAHDVKQAYIFHSDQKRTPK